MTGHICINNEEGTTVDNHRHRVQSIQDNQITVTLLKSLFKKRTQASVTLFWAILFSAIPYQLKSVTYSTAQFKLYKCLTVHVYTCIIIYCVQKLRIQHVITQLHTNFSCNRDSWHTRHAWHKRPPCVQLMFALE